MVLPRLLLSVVFVAALAGGCSLVDTDPLQGGTPAVTGASSTTGDGATTQAATSASVASSGGGGNGGDVVASAASSASWGGGGTGGTPLGDGGSGTGGSGGAPSWCETNAPADAYLCADFDTDATGLTSPPWSNASFETADGASTLDASTSRSSPASARVALSAASEPGCGYVVLERHVPGAPDRLEVRFALHAEDTTGSGDEALVALVGWETMSDLTCSLIVGLGVQRGFVQEQIFQAGTANTDQFDVADSFFTGWHDVALRFDLPAGTLDVEHDGQEAFFVEADGFGYTLSPQCAEAVQPNTVTVRIGPHCELPPLVFHYDDILIAPW